VEGALYRDALKLLAYGLGGVFLVTILLRVLQTASDALNRLDLGGILLLLYILVFMLGIGYVLVAKGARQLQKIEEL
jgi:drug/metabolite transporter (DMT)-like permease